MSAKFFCDGIQSAFDHLSCGCPRCKICFYFDGDDLAAGADYFSHYGADSIAADATGTHFHKPAVR
jgi:hypothetical protein